MSIHRITAFSLGLLAILATAASAQEPEIAPSWLPGQKPPVTEGKATDAPPDRASPQHILSLLNVEPSDFHRLTDGNPIAFGEEETLVKLLYAVRRLEPIHVHRWTKKNRATWDDLVKQPEEHRGQFFPVRGWVTEVSIERPLPELTARFQILWFYRCEVENQDGKSAVVYVPVSKRPPITERPRPPLRTVPAAWPIDQKIKEPVSFQGMFLKLEAGQFEDPGKPVFVAKRVAWHPDNLLGNLGVDVGRFDNVRHRTGLLGDDTPCFYETLDAMKRLKAGQLRAAAENAVGKLKPLRGNKPMKEFHVAQMFISADQALVLRRRLERLESLPGLSKRIVDRAEIIGRIEDEAQREILKAEVDQLQTELAAVLKRLDAPADVAFDPPTREAQLKLKQWADEQMAQTRGELDALGKSSLGQGQPMVLEGTLRQAVRTRVEDEELKEQFGIDHYYHAIVFVDLGGRFKLRKEHEQEFTRFAVHLCLPNWPKGMPLGEGLNEHVRISGVFFKLWAYKSASSQAEGSRGGHPAPLLIGTEPIWYRETKESNNLYAMIGGGLFLIVLLSIVLWLFRANRGDRKLRRQLDADDNLSLDHLKLD